jgi:1,4-dihydroxy-2-naphthoyl-CoA hydrolase
VKEISTQDGSLDVAGTFVDLLNIEAVSTDGGEVKMKMTVTRELTQPFGFLHGGATLSLLETVASVGAGFAVDPDEKPFGVHVDVRHRKSGLIGDVITATARLIEESGPSEAKPDRRTQIWEVVAHNQAGALISEGIVEMRVVRGM